jgi:hypothetical protein
MESSGRDRLERFVPRLAASWYAAAPEVRYRQLTGTLAFADLSGFTAMSDKLAVPPRASCCCPVRLRRADECGSRVPWYVE